MKEHKQKVTINNVILKHVKNNIRDYFLLLIFFLLGIVLGVFFVNHTSIEQKQEIDTYINEFVNSLKQTNNIYYGDILRESLIKNIMFSIILWLIGLTVTLFPAIYGIIAFRGFCLGYTISSLIGSLGLTNGIIISTASLLMQNIFFIPAAFGLAVSGIRLYKNTIGRKDRQNLVETKRKTDKSNLKIEIIRHSLFSLIITGILVLSSFIETYCSANLLNLMIKYI